MAFDFEREYGVNAGYVQSLFEEWKQDRTRVDPAWSEVFERIGAEGGLSAASPVASPAEEESRAVATATEEPAETPSEAAPRTREPATAVPDADLEPLIGVAGRIVANMEASLELPTATSVRTLAAKVLHENRTVLNEHMQLRALGKASYTHLIAFAMTKALSEMPRLLGAYVEKGERGYRKLAKRVNLGLAIDVAGSTRGPGQVAARMLVVPSIKGAETHSFREFHAAYEDLVQRGREGKLGAADFAETNVTLTNPGGFGTEMSVPRLMKGQSLIVATGSIGVPAQVAGASVAALARIGVGPVMTVTSTYDHRVVQGAESGLFLKRLDGLLQGADGFYDEVFRSMRVPWSPFTAAQDTGVLDPSGESEKQTRVFELISAYRVRGCRIADLDPLEYRPDRIETLDPATYGFTVWDLDRTFLCGGMLGRREMTLREILEVLRRAYCRRWTVEYMHIVDKAQKQWIRERVENPSHHFEFSREHRVEILRRLHRAENLERFLHARYVGNKRFSLEGADTLIPALAELIERASEQGVERIVIGMAHRGRLNVLANILGKDYEQIFREFEGVMLPLSSEGSGDVKYHLGQRGTFKTRAGREVEVVLAANPSHLEAVDPVVCGMTRAHQDALGDRERKRVLAVLIHGDAAFSGQGVVAETLNMSALRAYSNGGTLHVVVNNQIGFTTGPRDLRSTYYCTDVAKSVQAPIFHANGDYPESVLGAVRTAVDFQRHYGRDAVVDMVCYRRWGHNEGDEPAYTQPVLYAKIKSHPTVVDHYRELLERRGNLAKEELDAITQAFQAELEEAKEKSSRAPLVDRPALEIADEDSSARDLVEEPSPETGIAHAELALVIDTCNRIPAGHVTHPNLLRQLRRRETMVRGELGVDWGCAEALAFGTLLRGGVPIRLSGQDSGRGTFSQRHAVIRDQVTEKDYVPLAELAPGVTFEAWDSLLSEEAVLAFEYGYALARRSPLVLWEAQFGDFANGAQIAIDQFIAAGESKWDQTSGVVLLLPHGFDGQGPEHSSARVERFLALCAGGNMSVANCSTSAQYFHLLRRQGLAPSKRPLVVLTPKSLLREKFAASPIADFERGGFREVIADPIAGPAKRVILCSGKVYYDLAQFRAAGHRDDVLLVRVEQLYPFPARELGEILGRHPGAELVWAQEEPRNMGAWSFVVQRFRDLALEISFAGRAESASPATGSYRRHSAEQEHLVRRAFGG